MDELPPLWAHQIRALEIAKQQRELALFMDLGTGKSRTTVEILRFLFNRHKKILRTIIVCPTSVRLNWLAEIKKFSKIPHGKVFPLTGSLAQREKILQTSPEDSIFITNFEAFAFPNFVNTVLENVPDVLIIDESHRCKESTAKRTKALIKISQKMEVTRRYTSYRYILTGTPVLNSQMDLFTQFLILDGGRTFGMNFFEFRGKYFYDKNAHMPKQKHFPNWQARADTTEKLKSLISKLSVQAKKEECLDLPPLLRTEVEVELSREQARAYGEMKKEFIAFLDSGVATAQLAITKALRLQQILSGFIKKEDGENHVFKENPRLDALKDILNDMDPGAKYIIWSIFHQDYEHIKQVCDGLKLPYAEVTGLVKDKQAEIDRFQTDVNCRVMIASQSAGGTGVNMTAADTMIYYSRSYSLEHDMQSEARNYRGGSDIHDKITRIDLVAKGTVDDIVLKALREKKCLAEQILDLKKYL